MRMALVSDGASLLQMLTISHQQALGSVVFGAREERPRSPKEKSQSKTFTDAFGVSPKPRAQCLPANTGEPNTSEDSELGMDCDLPNGVLGHALIHVLIPRRPQRLDPQHGPRTPVKLDRLPWAGKRGQGQAGVPGVQGGEMGAVHTCVRMSYVYTLKAENWARICTSKECCVYMGVCHAH